MAREIRMNQQNSLEKVNKTKSCLIYSKIKRAKKDFLDYIDYLDCAIFLFIFFHFYQVLKLSIILQLVVVNLTTKLNI